MNPRPIIQLPDAQVKLDLKPPSTPHLTMGSPADDDLSIKNTKKLEKDVMDAAKEARAIIEKENVSVSADTGLLPPKVAARMRSLDYEWEDLSTPEEEE